MVCGGKLCSNAYIVSPEACAYSELQVCLCLASDMACLPVPESIPKTCALLPCKTEVSYQSISILGYFSHLPLRAPTTALPLRAHSAPSC